MLITLTAAVIAVIGLVLTGGGGWLLSLGGSPYYIVTGIAFLVTAVLLLRRSGAALWLYALIVLGSLGWAVWEVGFDWWQLGPRGGVIVLIGLWLMLPAIRRPLGVESPTGIRYPASALPLAVASVIAIAVAGYAMTQDPHDLAGDLPTTVANATPALGGNVPAGEWHQYGRTPYGQRYSPLDQINTDNVNTLKVAWQYQTGDVKLPDVLCVL